MPDSAQALSRAGPLWVGEDGWYQPHDYWLSLCGLYRFYAFALERLEPLEGRTLLDCGCGKGHTSVMLAKHGASVTAFDTSEADLATARGLAEANGVEVTHRNFPFEQLQLPDAAFDLAFGACVLHHVDVSRAVRELARVLKPDGLAVFIENSAANPLLMFARRYVVGSFGIPRYGDDHEHPLGPHDLDAIRASFPGTMQIHYPDFVFFRLADFYVLCKRVPVLTRLMAAFDRLCGRIPGIRKLGYFLVIELRRGGLPPAAPPRDSR